MDVNITVRFRGFLCEIQMHVRTFFELKDGAHPCYEACRSLGLVGSLRREAPPQGKLPRGNLVCVTVLRFVAGLLAVLMSSWYLLVGLGFGSRVTWLPELLTESAWVRVVICCCAVGGMGRRSRARRMVEPTKEVGSRSWLILP